MIKPTIQPQKENRQTSNVVRRLMGTALMLWAVAIAAPVQANAETYPTKQITVTVGSAPGGIDTLVRMLTDSMNASLGQPVIIVNRPGANGLIGVEAVKRAAPDGYNILFATVSTMVMNPLVYKNATYDATADFEPIAHHAFMPMVWIANKDTGFRSLKDVVEFSKKNPGKLNMANHGAGGMAAVFEALFAKQHKIDVALIPHNGAAQSILRLTAGDVQVSLETLSVVMPRIKSGDVIPLAVTSGSRIPSLPNVPSWTEAGMPAEYGNFAWYGFFAPKGTPKPVVDKLNAAINKALQEPRVRNYMEAVGGVFELFTAQQFRNQVAKDQKLFSVMIPAAGITPD
jgi:tripartite-type tricarboxylate transporter receptor subunit TctC